MNTFFVGRNGLDCHSQGMSPDKPLHTIDYALRMCLVDNEDSITVLPGHREELVGGLRLANGVTLQGSAKVRCAGEMEPTLAIKVPNG